MGLPEKAKFICVQIRDNAHDTKFSPVGLDSSYNEFRNSDIRIYEKVFELLTERGFWVIRMGKLTASQLQSPNLRIIDYSNSGERTELLDLWLCFHCTFMITTGSGIDALAAIGRKPLVGIDVLAYLDTTYFFRNSLIIYKHLYDSNSGKRLSMKEILELESQSYYKSSNFYRSRNIEWRSNSIQEIDDVVQEMLARLDNSWIERFEDKALHQTVGQMFAESSQYHSQYKSGFVHRIGTKFLRSL